MEKNLEGTDNIDPGMMGDNSVVRFVSLVLYQGFHDGAAVIIFTLEQITFEQDLAQRKARREETESSLRAEMEPEEVRELLEFLDECEAQPDETASPQRFAFTIKYHTPQGIRVMASPPAYLYGPVINRLCVMSNIRYWARGPVAGFVGMELHSLGNCSCTVHSDDLKRQLTLSRATAKEIEEFASRPPTEVPALPEPLPDQPVPEFVLRPVPPPDKAHAVVWFLSRTVFYAFAHLCILMQVTFNASLKSALPGGLCAGFAFASKLLELPGSLLPFGGYPWQGPVMTFAFWGMGIACFVQCSTKRRA